MFVLLPVMKGVNKLIRVFLIIAAFALALAIGTLKSVDRIFPHAQPYYETMMSRLDSLGSSLVFSEPASLMLGFAKISITPDSVMAMAGYGARRLKTFNEIRDSVFIRTLVIKSGTKKVAILSADLLIIHPEITEVFAKQLRNIGWNKHEVFLAATHTHSGIGQWAPGLVGELMAGDYKEEVGTVITHRMIASIQQAESRLMKAFVAFSESSNSDLVLNRLVGEQGIEDPFLKSLIFKTEKGNVFFSAFSAHATCLTRSSRMLSGDFPSDFHRKMKQDPHYLFSIYAAGPVGSMSPEIPPNIDAPDKPAYLGEAIATRIQVPETYTDSLSIATFRIPMELGSPQFKISKNLALRSYLFNMAFGDGLAEISGLVIGNTLIIGTPCDFSGELALPLYQFAQERGLHLIITSFNGGYIGYVTRDEWYDLRKDETRTMSWYGPGNGAYFTDIIKKIIVLVYETHPPLSSD